MQGLTKLIAIAAIAFGAYYFYNEFFGSGASALEGTWRSNKELSLLEAERGGISEGQRALLARVYGKMTYEIGDGVWKATMDGTEFGGAYEVVSKSGDCYLIRTSEPQGAEREDEVCIRDGRMYVPSELIGVDEVFDRI